MKSLVAALLLAAALPASGGTLPSRFDVRGVAVGSVLNVRADATIGSPVISTLPADAEGVEVVSVDPSGRWGRVNAGEGSGWVSLHYLTEQPGVWPAGALPGGLRCFGTEPFWSLAPDGTSARFETPEGTAEHPLGVLDLGIPSNPRRALVLGDNAGTATITPQACSDGMSDRAFGLEILLVLDEGGTPRLLSGCCSVAAR